MSSFTALVIAALLIFQAIGIYGDPEIVTGIAEAPPYNGSWYLCSNFKTTYMSFSVHVLDDQTLPVTEGLPGNQIPGKPPVPLPKFRPALNVFQLIYQDVLNFANASLGDFGYLPSLSCYEKPVQVCDQDAGDLPLPFMENQCVLAVNPTAQPVRFNVSVSFTKSVFNQTFTSPDVPGGTSSSSSTTKNYKLIGFDNLMVTILFSTILVYNSIRLF